MTDINSIGGGSTSSNITTENWYTHPNGYGYSYPYYTHTYPTYTVIPQYQCEHCYCIKDAHSSRGHGPHRGCCKCMSVLAEEFLDTGKAKKGR